MGSSVASGRVTRFAEMDESLKAFVTRLGKAQRLFERDRLRLAAMDDDDEAISGTDEALRHYLLAEIEQIHAALTRLAARLGAETDEAERKSA
jgi:hypothetical protein